MKDQLKRKEIDLNKKEEAVKERDAEILNKRQALKEKEEMLKALERQIEMEE